MGGDLVFHRIRAQYQRGKLAPAARRPRTGDFYLPGQDLYIELTTLRPQLSTHKNQKIKRLQELYPEIRIKLLKRREMRAMMVKYGLYDEADELQGTDAQKTPG